MSYSDQAPFDVRCEWGREAIDQLAPSDIVIIVDVLSFSTTVDVAVSRGVTVFPYRWHDESAGAYAVAHEAVLAVSRNSPTGRYSLSPSSLVNAPPDLRLVLPSANGSTIAFQAAHAGARVVAGCLRNAAAVGAFAQASAKTITVVPAGERWRDGSLRVAVEDLWGAGAILGTLRGKRSPEAAAAVAAFEAVATNLADQLRSCTSGRELIELGFERDVQLAAELNISATVPLLEGESIAAAPRM
jgi:2-phosphosulfolactate phosphatase